MSGMDWGLFADKVQLALENSEQGDPQSGTSGLEVEFNILDRELMPAGQVGYGPEARSFADYLDAKFPDVPCWIGPVGQKVIFGGPWSENDRTA